MRVAWSSDHGQDLDFWYFLGHHVDFFDFSRRSVYVLVRSLRSLRVGGVARLLNEISVFFGFWYFFMFRVFLGHFSQFWLFIMKNRLFLTILSNFSIFSNLWLFIMNGRLFITKKDCFWSFHQIQVFLVICGFLS